MAPYFSIGSRFFSSNVGTLSYARVLVYMGLSASLLLVAERYHDEVKKEALGSNCLQFFSDGLWLQAVLGVDVEGGVVVCWREIMAFRPG